MQKARRGRRTGEGILEYYCDGRRTAEEGGLVRGDRLRVYYSGRSSTQTMTITNRLN
jgi:hypothetical protein